jgi:hypothetical protein
MVNVFSAVLNIYKKIIVTYQCTHIVIQRLRLSV